MGFMDVNPNYQALLAQNDLLRPDDVLDLPGLIVSGHPGRNVSRITLGTARHRLRAFLKREYAVRWQERLANALAGFGFVSRSRREARVLRELARVGGGGPEWIASGEDDRGRAFVLLAAADNSVELRSHLRQLRLPRPDVARERRYLARALGAKLARLHQAGFQHYDLYAKHVWVEPATGQVTFLDWQRARRQQAPADWTARLRDLAALDATLADDLVSARERLVCLRSYLEVCGVDRPSSNLLVRRVRDASRALLRKHHVREVRSSPVIAEQGVLWLDGEALCVTPEFHAELRGQLPGWLRGPLDAHGSLTQTVVPLTGGRRGMLTWRRQRSLLGWLSSLFWPRPLVTPEVREAGVLFRRQRLGQPTPRLLAFGQRRRAGGRTESFLLTELPRTESARRIA